MRHIHWSTTLFLLFTLAASALYLRGVPVVPFHPDESTFLFMSSDVARLADDPGSVYWSVEKEGDLRQHYRVIDAPLTRYLLEGARTIAGEPALRSDWDWSKSWDENQRSGALPDLSLLLAGRWGTAILFPLDLLLIYATGRRMQGRLTGWLAALLLAGNALVLLHTRRAMAESVLLFTTLLATWLILKLRRHTWLAALPVALAVNSKHSAVALLIPGLLGAVWPGPDGSKCSRRAAKAIGFLALFAATIVAFNPFLWSAPVCAAQQVWQARSRLTENMTMMVTATNPELVQHTIPERLAGAVTQLFFTRPAVMDVANYADELRAAEQIYLANPFHTLLRNPFFGGLLMGAALFGMILAGRRAMRFGIEQNRELILLLAASLAVFLLLGVSIPVPFQRYYLPLVPFACLWAAYGLVDLLRLLRKSGGSPG